MKRVTFSRWPVWNYQFPERDVRSVVVRYHDASGALRELAPGRTRLAVGRNGVCALVLLEKHDLPALAERPDAVLVDYEV